MNFMSQTAGTGAVVSRAGFGGGAGVCTEPGPKYINTKVTRVFFIIYMFIITQK